MVLSATQKAQAHHHTYALFSQLFLHGITAEYLPYLQSIPELADILPDQFDPDEAAANHQNLFGFNIFPNAAIFLDPSRLLGGRIANQHANLYQQNNFVPDSAVDPDHISQSLAFMAHLSAIEANALAANIPADSHSQQYHFLENHFLPWLIPFTIAIQHQTSPFYTQLAHLTLALTTDHYTTIQPPTTNHQPPTTIHQLPINQSTNPLSLEDGRTGLREIARYLVTPILSGLYLGRNDINRLARHLNLPHGFGSRDQMLQTLLQSAGQYDNAPQLFATLQELLANWQHAYNQVAQEHPEIAHLLPPWQTRLHQTQQLLTQIEEKL